MSATERTSRTPPVGRYYEDNAQRYIAQTFHVNMSQLYAEFLPFVADGGCILDAGSGSGRDTLEFLHRGYVVEAFDSSPALAAASTHLTGIPTAVLRFQEFASSPRFDGIWACASLLHVPKHELRDAVARLVAALRSGGALYASFKYGSGERVSRDGRLFVDLTEPELRSLLSSFADLIIRKIWITEGEGALRGRDRWLNVIVTKTTERETDDA
jgi:SAM-dependent methyltransferase